jgi:tripartite-type tricarboxylate transporter receptor subunit TctC
MKTLLVAVAAAALSWPGASFAQAYPVKPVRYLVPFPAGGSPDIVARLLGERLNRIWGQPVVIENRGGAGGTVAAAVAAKAAPDGYTLLQCNIASNAIAYSLYAKLPYHPLRDFAPISRIGTTPSGLVVHPTMPAATIGEFIAYAKANPGKVSYGSTSAGSSPQLAMELFKSMANINVVHIAYKGAAPAIADLLGGQIPAAIANVPALLAPVQAGRIRALAVTSAKRASAWPSVPTLAESGMPGFDVTSWYGVCAPAGTPRRIIDKLHADVSTVLLSPEVQQRMNELVVDAAPTSPEELAAFIRAETSRWAKVVKDAGIPQQ